MVLRTEQRLKPGQGFLSPPRPPRFLLAASPLSSWNPRVTPLAVGPSTAQISNETNIQWTRTQGFPLALFSTTLQSSFPLRVLSGCPLRRGWVISAVLTSVGASTAPV